MSFEFRQRFDGTQPEVSVAEQEYVATIFSSCFDNLVLRNIGAVRPRSTLRGEPEGSRLTLAGHDQDNENVRIRAEEDPRALDYRKQLELEARIEDSSGYQWPGDIARYRLGEDGVVRRIDSNWENDKLIGTDPPSPASVAYRLRRVIRPRTMPLTGDMPGKTEAVDDSLGNPATVDHDLNCELETQMGLNNQPVGIAELEEVLAIAETGV